MADTAIRFVLNREDITLKNRNPNTTVLQYLRDERRLCGTKEGCASGDCGACTVVLAEACGERLQYRAINSCIALLTCLHGKQLLTVEDIADGDQLHAVQQALVDSHASQCGFCTPGFVMSLFALHKQISGPDSGQAARALAGNLCRCTGYQPIINAATGISSKLDDQFNRREQETLEQLRQITAAGEFGLSDGSRQVFCPVRISALGQLLITHPDANLVAGGTDLVLEITQQLKDFETLIYVGNVVELKQLDVKSDCFHVGAAVTYSELEVALAAEYPEFVAMIHRLGSLQIRNLATVGGNIGNASPIGDMPPVLIALGATLTLRLGEDIRQLPLEDYFIDYKVTVQKQSEFIQHIEIPRARPGQWLKVYKIAKRFDDDISSVLAAFHLVISENKITEVRVAFGGMAAIPKRATNCEAKLLGQPWHEDSIELAAKALALDFEPITDIRASADYRMQIAKNLLHKCFLEITQPDQASSVFARESQGGKT